MRFFDKNKWPPRNSEIENFRKISDPRVHVGYCVRAPPPPFPNSVSDDSGGRGTPPGSNIVFFTPLKPRAARKFSDFRVFSKGKCLENELFRPRAARKKMDFRYFYRGKPFDNEHFFVKNPENKWPPTKFLRFFRENKWPPRNSESQNFGKISDPRKIFLRGGGIIFISVVSCNVSYR